MEVSCFFGMLERAMRFTYIDHPKKPIRDIHVVSLEAMQEAFRNNRTWSGALVSDPPSKFVQFLCETCAAENPPDVDQDLQCFRVKDIRCLAVLWCEDAADEKVEELSYLLYESDCKVLEVGRREFRQNFFLMLDVATSFVYRFEEKYTEIRGPQITEKETKDTHDYEKLADKFEREVFGSDTRLRRDEWMQRVLRTQPWIFRPKGIRE